MDDKELELAVYKLIENEDIEGLTDLLINWHNKNSLWLIYIESRLCAPSTTKDQAERLNSIRNKALTENPQLTEEAIMFIEDTYGQNKEAGKDFEYSETDKEIAELVETVEELQYESESLEDEGDENPKANLVSFLESLQLNTANSVIQHIGYKIIYMLTATEHVGDGFKQYINSKTYKDWHNKCTPESIIKDINFSFDDLKSFCNLQNATMEPTRKEQYASYLEEGDIDKSFPDFLEYYGSHFKFHSTSTDRSITAFEKKYQVSLPEELKLFYKTIGGISGDPVKAISIYSLEDLIDNLSYEDENEYHLKSMGILDALNYYRAYEIEAFSPEGDIFSKEEFSYLNTQYNLVGNILVNDNVNVIIYYDKKGKFGTIWHDQDYDCVFDHYLTPMLNKSLAQHSLAPLLGTLTSSCCFDFDYHDDNLENFFLELRDI